MKKEKRTLCCFTGYEKRDGEWYDGTKFDMLCKQCGFPCMLGNWESHRAFVAASIRISKEIDRIATEALSPLEDEVTKPEL